MDSLYFWTCVPKNLLEPDYIRPHVYRYDLEHPLPINDKHLEYETYEPICDDAVSNNSSPQTPKGSAFTIGKNGLEGTKKKACKKRKRCRALEVSVAAGGAYKKPLKSLSDYYQIYYKPYYDLYYKKN